LFYPRRIDLDVTKKLYIQFNSQDYYADVDAIIFLVDAADRTRLDEARVELEKLFEVESLQHVFIAYYCGCSAKLFEASFWATICRSLKQVIVDQSSIPIY